MPCEKCGSCTYFRYAFKIKNEVIYRCENKNCEVYDDDVACEDWKKVEPHYGRYGEV